MKQYVRSLRPKEFWHTWMVGMEIKQTTTMTTAFTKYLLKKKKENGRLQRFNRAAIPNSFSKCNIYNFPKHDNFKSYYFGPANLPIILAMIGATFGFSWCFARLAGFFITANKPINKNQSGTIKISEWCLNYSYRLQQKMAKRLEKSKFVCVISLFYLYLYRLIQVNACAQRSWERYPLFSHSLPPTTYRMLLCIWEPLTSTVNRI